MKKYTRHIHGMTKHPLYRKWQDMKNRCHNPKVDRYKCYGLRGIKVCDEWKGTFTNFYNWCLEMGWKEGLQIDRIDNDMDYSPENCRITNHIEQGYNKRNTRFVIYNNEKICFSKLIKDLNLTEHYYDIYTWHVRNGNPLIEIIQKYSSK